jgi:arsenite methyltransferase
MSATTHEQVREYYGETLRSTADLRTSACCSADALAPHIAAIVSELHPEVLERFYGCGSPLPPALDGATVVDLGCGTGRDLFVASKLVGEHGRVIGIDMTDAQLAVAERHRGFHAERFGHARSNVSLHRGKIEDLGAAGLADESVDVVISNCALNLAPDKARVFAEIFRMLRPGGELYFSDVFADRRIPADLASDPVLRGECLGGALYWEDFRRLLAGVGCVDARVTARSEIAIEDPEVERRIGMVGFSSVTVRAFKLPFEDRCEDYGQVATYRGTIAEHPHAFALDDHHILETGRPMLVCGNTADMLSATRYAPHFTVTGDKSVHHGPFACTPAEDTAAAADGGCC